MVFPHFGDQPYNSINITGAGVGISLIWWLYALKEGADERNHFFTSPMFTGADVKEAFRRIVEEPSFRMRAQELRCAART